MKTTLNYTLVMVMMLFTNPLFSQNFNIVGHAVEMGDFTWQLTDYNSGWGFGAAWHDQTISLDNSFDYRFEMNFGERDGDGADGIVFALQQQSTSAGQAGEGMGILMVQPSLFVEFDTWQNGNRNDPVEDHAAIFRDGNVDHGSWQELDGAAILPNLEDNQFHAVRVKWDVATQTFSVHFDCTPILSYTGDIVNEIFGGDPNVFWGFTAAIGGNSNQHTVRLANAEPPRDTLPDYAICAGQQVEFLNLARGAWNWSEAGGGTGSIVGPSNIGGITVAPTVTTEYIATVSDECDAWTERVIVQVGSEDAPVITDVELCQDADPIALNSTAAQGTWTGNGITNSNTGEFDPVIAGPGQHTVTYSNNDPDCPAQGSGTVTVHPNPTISAGEDQEVCIGTMVGLAGSGGDEYTWTVNSSGETISEQIITVTPNETETYSLTAVDINGCTGADEVTVTINSSVDATITPAGPFCTADQALDMTAASPGGVWSGPGIVDQQSGTFDPQTLPQGDHTIRYEIGGACPAFDEQVITIIDFPDPTIEQIGPFCDYADPVELVGATAGGVWTLNGQPLNTPTIDPVSIGAGRHSVTYAFGGGCPIEDEMEFEVLPSVIPKLEDVPALCVTAEPVLLEADIAIGTWSGSGVETDTFDPGIAGAGTHTVQFDIPDACGFPQTMDIVVHPTPDPTITEVPVQCIEFDPITLAAATPDGFWSGPGITSNTAGLFTPSVAGLGTHSINYALQVEGCAATDSIEIIVSANDLDLGPDTTMCTRGGESILLDPGNHATYEWSTGSSSPVLQADQEAVYSLTVWDENGCVAQDQMEVTDHCDCNVWYPNAFTPNGDGINEAFQILGEAPLGLDFYVMNRWGDMLFHGTSLDDQWSGMVRDKSHDLKSDVFVVKVVCPDKAPEYGRITVEK